MGTALTLDQKADYCACHRMTILYMFDSPYWNESLNIVLTFSGLVFLAIFLQIIFNKQLQSHPAPLIAALCLSESFFCFMGMSRTLICSEYGNAEWLLAKTLYFDTSIDS